MEARRPSRWVSGAGKLAAGTFARLLLVLPASWLLYQIGFAVSRCFEFGMGAGECLELVVVTPFMSFIPAIDDAEEPPLLVPYLSILIVAIAVSMAWTMVQDRSRR